MAANPTFSEPGKVDGTMMPPPMGSLPGCPPGLEYLGSVDQLLCKQKVEMLQVLTGIETNNHYIVNNSMGQQVYRVVEDTDCLMRICCGTNRGFVLRVVDNVGQEVMRFVREFKCCAGCCWCASADCCAFEVRVEAPPGQPIGYARQMQSCWRIMIEVLNEQRERVFVSRGPICPCGCQDVNFPVMDASESTEVCRITKQWGGFCRESCTNAENFGVTFPMDLDIKMKGTLMGALFLIDFMAFEYNGNNG